MSNYKPGVRVVMNERCKSDMGKNSPDHIKEFESQVGTIIGLVWLDLPDTWDVKWDSGFKYMYPEEYLDIVLPEPE